MSGFVLCCSASQGSSFVLSSDWARVPVSVPPAALPSIPSLTPLCHGPICQSLSGNSPCFESTASDWPVSVPSASVLHVRRPSGLFPAQSPCPRPRGAPYPSGASPPREEHGAEHTRPTGRQSRPPRCVRPLPADSHPPAGTGPASLCPGAQTLPRETRALFPLRAGRVCGDSAMGLRSTRPWICRCVLSCRAPLIPFLLHASLGSPGFPGACLHHPAREPPPRRGRPPAPRPGPRQDLLLL